MDEKRKAELKDIIKKARDELSDIETAEQAQANQHLVGKCFKYRNSYSCPKPDEYWWLYSIVTGLDEGELIVWSFQDDRRGRIEITTDLIGPTIGMNYIEIPPSEFWRAWALLNLKLNSLFHAPQESSHDEQA